jgi:fructokinase
MGDFLIVGEALVDIVEQDGVPTTEHPGGSPANVALGLARLGHHPHLLTRLGTDRRGETVRTHLAASGVRLLPGSRTPDRTSTATARLDSTGVASYDFDLDWRLPEDVPVPPVAAVHTGSIAAFLPPGGDAVLDLIRRVAGSATVSYDPNARPGLMGDPAAARHRVETFVGLADLVKVSDEDLAWLAPGEDPAAVAADWLARGPAAVVVTRGPDGAFAICAAGTVQVAAPEITVVDTVGAGDAFTAALLDHLATAELLGADRREQLHRIETAELAAALDRAVRISALTCTRPGADPPSRAELDS